MADSFCATNSDVVAVAADDDDDDVEGREDSCDLYS